MHENKGRRIKVAKKNNLKYIYMTSLFWIKDPSILINKKQILNFWPMENMSRNEKLNSISRLVIILTIIGTLITQSYRMIITGIITLGVIVLLYFIQKKEKSNKEGFSSINFINKNYQPPTNINPLMNVALTDYKDLVLDSLFLEQE